VLLLGMRDDEQDGARESINSKLRASGTNTRAYAMGEYHRRLFTDRGVRRIRNGTTDAEVARVPSGRHAGEYAYIAQLSVGQRSDHRVRLGLYAGDEALIKTGREHIINNTDPDRHKLEQRVQDIVDGVLRDVQARHGDQARKLQIEFMDQIGGRVLILLPPSDAERGMRVGLAGGPALLRERARR
jgi:hypothetical protein